jgi:hypothetical protein
VNLLAVQRSTSKLWQIDGSAVKGIPDNRDTGTRVHGADQSKSAYSIWYIGCFKWENRIQLPPFTALDLPSLTRTLHGGVSGSSDH